MSLIRALADMVKSGLAFVVTVFRFLLRSVKGLIRAVIQRLGAIFRALGGLWRALGPRWFRVVLALALVGFGVMQGLRVALAPNFIDERITQVHYLNGGWTEQQRQQFYFTPQGTELLGMEYDWFVNLELPLSTELLATPENMRGWGFITDPGQLPTADNPGNLPIGMGRHIDPVTQTERVDLGCAMCHTGELHYQGVALRVDGGQAVQSIATMSRGEFVPTLAAAVLETRYNPAKWNRFAQRLVGDDAAQRDGLKRRLDAFISKLIEFGMGAGAPWHYPTTEGRGRLDAVGRIGNMVFGYDIAEPDNYRVADAPVSYPFLWDIWRFDWVQYSGFTSQPMGRNVGEALGVFAPIKLVDDDGKLLPPESFGQTLIDLDGLQCVETTLHSLEPPKWPEAILGDIDITKAKQGKALFQSHCRYCHGPHISEPYQWPIATGPDSTLPGQIELNWRWDTAGNTAVEEGKTVRPDARATVWSMPWLLTSVIGTDPTAADNYVDTRYDASKLLPGAPPVNAGDGLQVLLNRLIPTLYEHWGIEGEAVADYDGFNIPLRTAHQRAYKARPLHGVWATPPFLHNGSVPSIYHLLSPLRERPKTFYVGHREYDPQRLGYASQAVPGAFLFDTDKKGNSNQGHLFTDVDMPGRIGELFTEAERFALLEYLKVMGNPDFTDTLGGDPMNWAQYSTAPDTGGADACVRQRQNHASAAASQELIDYE